MTKKLILASTGHETNDIFQIYGGPVLLVDFINKLEKIKEDLLEEGWQDIKIDINHSYYYDSADTEINLYGLRLETDKEYEKRLKQEAKTKKLKKAKEEEKQKTLKRKEAEELAEYARLKAKYEK